MASAMGNREKLGRETKKMGHTRISPIRGIMAYIYDLTQVVDVLLQFHATLVSSNKNKN